MWPHSAKLCKKLIWVGIETLQRGRSGVGWPKWPWQVLEGGHGHFKWTLSTLSA